ncbi:MAG: hypothetical protein QM779_01440 [Propionicimonas sp.]|uniref:hypothetical protein n=1 Tax=Propionicimonas sp. TaxID=1955623 RepID=UPI003D1253D7
MTGLSIERLSATAAADWPAPGEVDGMLRRIAADRLGPALAAQPLPEGEWCVRRIDVDVDLDPERPLSALETDWADRIVTALRQSLRDGSRDVVRYLRPEQAVDDLLRGLATGRAERAWAWGQVGLWHPGDPDPRSDPRGLFLAVLARLPQGPSAALDRLVRRVGFAPVHRLLGSEGWTRVTGLVAPGLDLAVLLGDPADVVPSRHPKRRAAAASDRARLARTIIEGGTLPAAIRSTGIRADVATARSWALLTVAASDPSLLRRPTAQLGALVRDVAALLTPGPARTLGERRGTDAAAATAQSAAGPSSRPTGADPAGDPTDARASIDSRPAPATDEPAPATDVPVRPRPSVEALDPVADEPEPAHTAWGGLAFLLHTAADAGLPTILDEPPFLARPAAWVLRLLGSELVGAAEDDPALLVLSGAEAVTGQPAPADDERAAIRTCAARWASATAARLRAGRDGLAQVPDTDIVRGLARREATVRWEPGWVEVCLALADVDLDVRRAGLDLDPGWVWWLGQVVRIRYE